MLFQSREFHVPKDYETPQYYEDAAAVNAEAGRVAIADGVSSAVFSGAWAEILTRSVVAMPPNVRDSAQFGVWLAERRKEWAAGINVPSLSYHLLMKLRQVGGGFSTLSWIEVQRDEGAIGKDHEYVVHGQGVGDSCVFHVRDGQVLCKWPMRDSAEFEEDPISIGSVNAQRDQALEFQTFEWKCRAGDLLVLATDAVSAWIYRMLESGEAINLSDLSQLPDRDLAEYLTALRESHWLKRDDSTIVFVGLGQTREFLESLNHYNAWLEVASTFGHALPVTGLESNRAAARGAVASPSAEADANQAVVASASENPPAVPAGAVPVEPLEQAEPQAAELTEPQAVSTQSGELPAGPIESQAASIAEESAPDEPASPAAGLPEVSADSSSSAAQHSAAPVESTSPDVKQPGSEQSVAEQSIAERNSDSIESTSVAEPLSDSPHAAPPVTSALPVESTI